MSRRKKGIFVLAIASGMAAVAGAIWIASGSRTGPDIAIEGHSISREEYLDCMKSVEYDTKIQIQQEHGTAYSEDFWLQEYNGRAGYEILAENTVERLKYIHAVYDIAWENDDVEDASYVALRRRWENENSRRNEKDDNGEVIYGLKEYTFELYLQYEMSILKETYCNDGTREGMDLTDEEMHAHYDSREWTFKENEERADFDTAKVAVERELREQKYDDMVERWARDSKVDGSMEAVFQFTLKNIQ